MAVYTSNPHGGGYYPESVQDLGAAPAAKPLTRLANAAGAAMSVALIIGIGVWGYKLLVRDVTGIPVVRAAAGDMRVKPDNPGGQLAENQGLSVNSVASEGTADRFAERLILAPKPLDLEDEDQPILASMVTSAPQLPARPAQAAKPVPDVNAALQSGDVDGLVAQLTDGIDPMEEDSSDDAVEPTDVSASAADPLDMAVSNAVAVAMIEEPGVKASLRPKTRPATRAALATPASFTPETETDTAQTREMDAATLPVGTRLVQLGAFDSPEIARAQWDALNGRFGAYLEGKARVVQEASSGGRTFYRLRAHGFVDIADARRFCSALVAENADCIPVVTR